VSCPAHHHGAQLDRLNHVEQCDSAGPRSTAEPPGSAFSADGRSHEIEPESLDLTEGEYPASLGLRARNVSAGVPASPRPLRR
jgi:hypothetical protein